MNDTQDASDARAARLRKILGVGTAPPRTVFSSREAFIEALEHARNTVNTEFARRADISRLDLSGLDLSGLDLSGCLAVGTNLSRAIMRATKIENGNFISAQLDEVEMIGVSGQGAQFIRADLRLVKCDMSGFQTAYFTRSRMNGFFATRTMFQDAEFGNAKMAGAKLTESWFDGADFQNTAVRIVPVRHGDHSWNDMSNVYGPEDA